MSKKTGKTDPHEPSAPEPELRLDEKLELLPKEPGCYLFKDEHGKVIYIGKAKVLRNRVRSYFTGGSDGRYQYEKLVARIRDLEVIVTADEVEALVLEANLISKHRPRFNIDVRHDRSYPYLKVTKEPYPRVFLTRFPEKKEAARYYGPLTDVTRTRDTLNALRQACKIRTCNLSINAAGIRDKKHKICLEYHIGNCEGPCVGLVDRERYNDGVEKLIQTLHGKGEGLIAWLEDHMKELASLRKFEEAARVRDQLQSAQKLTTKQQRMTADLNDRDVFGFAREDNDGCIAVLHIRNGRLVGREHSTLSRLEGSAAHEILARFLAEYYLPEMRRIPRQVLLPVKLPREEREPVFTFLRRKRDAAVELRKPQRGELTRLVALADRNAEMLLQEYRLAKAKRDRLPQSLQGLQAVLDLPEPPTVIECFDNSNIFGSYPVAAMVQFRNARPVKKEYRHYRINGVDGIDDFASMREVVGRRYARLVKEQKDLPDLVLIDGGIGQVNAARQILNEMDLNHLPVAGLAKRHEEIVLPGGKDNVITLAKSSSALKLLMRIRDEAHRFAITFHRRLRSGGIASTLTGMPGIGEAKARALLKHFGSLKRLKEATPEQVAEVPGFSVEGGRALLDKLLDN